MSLTLEQIKKLNDKAYANGQQTRERASDELVFYHVTQWDDQTLANSQLSYRGEFNMLKKAANKVMSEMASNPAFPNFEPIAETRDDAAELMDGLWRRDARQNSSVEAFNTAAQESIICGVGAWLLKNEYRTNRGGDTRQVIRRYPINEANNVVFWDPNAKLVDKSDASYCSYLHAYSPDAYQELAKELTGEEADMSSFATPAQSYVFPWWSVGEQIYVVEFFHRTKVKKRFYKVQDLFGNIMTLDAEKVEDVIDEMEAAGQRIIEDKVSEVYQVTRYLCSGAEILEETVIPGEHIPIIPEYGYRAYVEGEEVYEGIVRTAKDPQRLRNFQLSYLADIMSRSPRNKQIYLPEQIKGFEYMYEDNGADNNYPYLLQHSAVGGKELPLGPVGEVKAQDVPQALAASIELTQQQLMYNADSGVPQNVADPDISGKAVIAIQNQIDMLNYEYQEKRKYAIRRDAEVYASMARDIYDMPQEVVVELPDGTRKKSMVMQMVLDEQTMEPVVINDLTSATFEVYAEIGPAYTTQKQQTRDEIITLAGSLADGDPLKQILLLKYVNLAQGDDMQDVRKYARDRLIMMGVKEPETPEEVQMVMQAQQTQQPDANMILAQGELLKGQASVMDAQTKQEETQIKLYEARTKRAKVQVDAQQAGVNINRTLAETQGIQIDNVMKLRGSAVA